MLIRAASRAQALGYSSLSILPPFLDPHLRRSRPTTMRKLDLGVAAMLQAKVFIKPTNLMADPIPTRFRLIFSQPRETMKLALRRIERAFGVPEAPFISNHIAN
ncbi:hypothetical protein C8J57DRAFT_1501244 [Mycena rebaudengoi]|nr:hypothetical protein C8J57DRAFT_1501244 [Mycena rebaudengoi]